MGSDIVRALRPTFATLLLFVLLLCVAYPLATLGLGQTLFPGQANGSLIRKGDRIIGSSLIGQNFGTDRYFWSRPSAAGKGYDASASSGSNLGPTSAALVERVRGDVAKLRASGVAAIPADIVTTSGSGLDPDISPEAALAQAPRVAAVRKLPLGQVRALVEHMDERPLLGILGEPRINVLLLNRQLDRLSASQGR